MRLSLKPRVISQPARFELVAIWIHERSQGFSEGIVDNKSITDWVTAIGTAVTAAATVVLFVARWFSFADCENRPRKLQIKNVVVARLK